MELNIQHTQKMFHMVVQFQPLAWVLLQERGIILQVGATQLVVLLLQEHVMHNGLQIHTLLNIIFFMAVELVWPLIANHVHMENHILINIIAQYVLIKVLHLQPIIMVGDLLGGVTHQADITLHINKVGLLAI